MPGGDRTGPWGEGPRTGRAAGFCTGYDAPGYVNASRGGRGGWGQGWGQGWGRGYGHGRGGGRGWGRGMAWRHGWGGYPGPYAYAPQPAWGVPAPSREDELRMLQDQAAQMEATLEDIRKRMTELEQSGKEGG